MELLSLLFLLLSGGMAMVVLGLLVCYLEGRTRIASVTIFAIWLLYAAILGYKGVIASRFPPGLTFLLLPTLLFLVTFLMRHPSVRKFALKVPVEFLVGAQGFRVFVELALYALYLHRLVPRLMTFEEGNLDILIGLSAPLVAWLYATRRFSDHAMRVWSWVGIVLLTNAVLRAALTSTGIAKAEIPNVALGLFPFTFLPGLLVPLAMSLHVLLLRSLPRERNS